MKWLLLILVRVYWRMWPDVRKRRCIFRKSCSHHVYDEAAQKGLVAGSLAFWYRIRVCRSGYTIFTSPEGFHVRLINGTVINETEVEPRLFESYRQFAQRRKREWNP
jgi:uncharacterized protein